MKLCRTNETLSRVDIKGVILSVLGRVGQSSCEEGVTR